MTMLSRLLLDENLRALFDKYGDEIVQAALNAATRRPSVSDTVNGCNPAPAEPLRPQQASSNDDMARLLDRVSALEAEQRVQQELFDALRRKIRPLALALGCCPECFVGVAGCPNCGGQSVVAYFPPDGALLESQVLRPLAARGVPLSRNANNHQPEVVIVGN